MKFSFKKGTPKRKDRAEKKGRKPRRRSAQPPRGLSYNKYPREAPRRASHGITCPNCGEGFELTPKGRSQGKRDFGRKPTFSDQPRGRDRDSEERSRFRKEGRRDFASKPSQRTKPRSQSFHTVNCSDCGRASEVPFKPTSNKPVYCDKCFKKKRR